MIHWMNETLPWYGWFAVGWFIGFTVVLAYAVMHAATVSDEWMEQEVLPCPRFTAWEVSPEDLEFERIVHRPVEHTVLVGAGEPR